MTLKPYPKYKDSELAWLNSYPETWNIKRGKNLLKAIDIRSDSGEEELLTVSSKFGVIPRKNASVTMFKADSYIGYKLCWKDDLVINSLWAWAGGLGISREHGIISSAYGVYRIQDTNQLIPEYLNALVRSSPYQWELQVRSKGIWTSRLQLTDASFLEAPILIPSVEEQKLITRYLNQVNNKIQKYISAKKKLIKLLEEQKQAIIHQVVTGAIDVNNGKPYASYKTVRADWFKTIPSHWQILKIKTAYSVRIGLTYSPEDITSSIGILVLRSSNIKDGKVVDADNVYVSKDISQKLIVKEGDILVCARNGSRNLVGKSALIDKTFEGSTYGAFMALIKGKNTQFLYWLLNSNMLPQIMSQFETSTINQLTQDSLRNIHILQPPEDEMKLIVNYLEQNTKTINKSIDDIKSQILLFQEYRTRLTSDIVTGKIDVRAAVKDLPEEIEDVIDDVDEESIDENNDISEVEESYE